jgi:hypothetical protein
MACEQFADIYFLRGAEITCRFSAFYERPTMSDENKTENGTVAVATSEAVRQKRVAPKQTLPSERLQPEKWQAAMRAYAVVFESNGGKPVTNEEAGSIIGMSGMTVVMTNAFLCDIKLLTRQKDDRQKDEPAFVPSPELLAYHKAYEWDPATAGEKLRPAFDRMWFSEVLVPRLKFRPYEVKEALTVLAEACGASKEYEDRLLVLLDLMAFAGVIVRDGLVIKSASTAKPGEKIVEPMSGAPVVHSSVKPPMEDGQDSYTLVLDSKTKRKVVIQAPHVITPKELERIRTWLGVQLIVEEDEPAK